VVAEAPKSELTTTLHLNLREVSNSPANRLEEIIASLPADDRKVIEAIQGSKSEKSMVIIARGPNKESISGEPADVRFSWMTSLFLVNTQRLQRQGVILS
jgi:hypothetical protein